jgi:hypothetical protein
MIWALRESDLPLLVHSTMHLPCKHHSFPTFALRMIFIIYTFPSTPSLSIYCRNNMKYLEVVEEIIDDSFGVFPCLASKTLLALTVVKFHYCNPVFII